MNEVQVLWDPNETYFSNMPEPPFLIGRMVKGHIWDEEGNKHSFVGEVVEIKADRAGVWVKVLDPSSKQMAIVPLKKVQLIGK